MKLSTLYTGGASPYIEFGWVTAPNTSGQSVSADTITTLTLDTEVADSNNLVSAPTSNQFTLPAGTYYYDSFVRFRPGRLACTFSLYNVTDAAYVSRTGFLVSGSDLTSTMLLNGQFTITDSKTFQLQLLVDGATATVDNGNIASGGATFNHTLSTAGADQRTTIKLWKLA